MKVEMYMLADEFSNKAIMYGRGFTIRNEGVVLLCSKKVIN